MGVHRNPVVLAKAVVEHDVCRLPADPGDREQVFRGLRHLAAKAVDQCLCGSDDMLCLCVVKPEPVDDGLDIRGSLPWRGPPVSGRR